MGNGDAKESALKRTDIVAAEDFCENDDSNNLDEDGEYIPTIALSFDQAEDCAVDAAAADNDSQIELIHPATEAGNKDTTTIAANTPSNASTSPALNISTSTTTRTATTVTNSFSDEFTRIPLHPGSTRSFQTSSSKISTLKSMKPTAVALPVGSILARESDEQFYVNNPPIPPDRGEFISIHLLKPTKHVDLGISFGDDSSGQGFCVAEIAPKGLIATSMAPLQAGDKVMSVNHRSCDCMTRQKALKLLTDAKKQICMVLQHRGGDPRIVEVMATKPNPGNQSGIGLSRPEMLDQLNVSCIIEDGLFGQSLLSLGDTVLSINGIPCGRLDPEAAADIIRSTPRYITIVAQKFAGNGMVVATKDTTKSRSEQKWERWSYYILGEQYGRRERMCRAGCCLFFCSTLFTFLILLVVLLQ